MAGHGAAVPGARLIARDQAARLPGIDPARLPRLTPCEVHDWMVETGTPFVTAVTLARVLGCEPAQVSERLWVPRMEGRVARVIEGGWVPARDGRVFYLDFLDAMMAYLRRDYHLACRTAAHKHGFSHQPSLWKGYVFCYPGLRSRYWGRVLVDFAERRSVLFHPTERRRSLTWFGADVALTVTTPEVTLWDCAADPGRSGGLDNVATIVAEMLQDGDCVDGEWVDRPYVDPLKIAETAKLYPIRVRQRLGFILDEMSVHTTVPFDTDPLRATLPASPRVWTLNGRPTGVPLEWVPKRFRLCRRWRLRVVDELDPDV